MIKRLFLIFFITLMVAFSAEAGVVLKVTATNPSEFEEQEVVVRSYLPAGIKPEHVLEKGELELAYDVKQGQYYVYKEVKLKPKASITYKIEIEDIWFLDEKTLGDLKSHTQDLVDKLKKTDYIETANKLKEMIEKNIAAILEKQAKAVIEKVSPIEHIGAFEANKELLATVKEDVGTLENLLFSLGGDPGKIMGESSIGARTVEEIIQTKDQGLKTEESKEYAVGSREVSAGLAAFRTAILNIEVVNPSSSEAQTVPVKYFLPKEIKTEDVIDSGELEVGFDFEKALSYLFKDKMELEPGEKKVFKVVVKDKWSLNETDLLSLKIHAENMVAALEGVKEFSAAKELGQEVTKKIGELLEKKGVPELTEEHIAGFREDTKKLEEVKKDIQRMEQVLAQAGVMPEVTLVDEAKLREAAEESGVSEARLAQVQKMKEARKGRGETGTGEGGGLGASGVKLLAGTIFKGKAPTTAATWKIIFIIIGFLAVVSFIFFAVWSAQVQKGRKIEKIQSDQRPQTEDQRLKT